MKCKGKERLKVVKHDNGTFKIAEIRTHNLGFIWFLNKKKVFTTSKKAVKVKTVSDIFLLPLKLVPVSRN